MKKTSQRSLLFVLLRISCMSQAESQALPQKSICASDSAAA